MDRNINDSFKFNQETEFVPILGLIASQLNGPQAPESSDKTKENAAKVASSNQQNHHPALLSVLAEELSVASEEIHDFELYATLFINMACNTLTSS